MQSTTDTELLRAYAHNGSEAAFGEIVRRYTDFVYSAALRQVCDAELARDVAQAVFVDLARKAASLHPNTLLIGWLCRGARLAALEQLRTQQRRLQREKLAMQLVDSSPETPNDWSAVRPVLDEALAGLTEEDRHALLLRFFKNESLAAVGATLGISEDAAQKRVSRALGKLRDFLSQRGIHTTAAALSVVLAANAVQSAPLGVAASLTAGALAQAAAGHVSFSILNLLSSHQMKTAIVSLLLAGGIAGLAIQQVKTQRQLRAANATIQQQAESLQALQGVQDQLASQSEELQRLRAEQSDTVRLRGELAKLQREAAASSQRTPAPAVATAAALPTNAPAAQMMVLTAKFVLVPTEDIKALNLAWSPTSDGSATLQLTPEQVQTLNQALDGASDVKVLGSPRVATGSGGTASFFAGPQGSSARVGSRQGGGGVGGSGSGGFSAAVPEDSKDGPANATTIADSRANMPVPQSNINVSTPDVRSSSQPRPGLGLSVLPTFTEGGPSFDLQLTATFGQWVDRSPQQDGSQKEVQTTESKVHLNLPAGQTALLAREVPADGWTEADATVPGPKTLLVFLTPAHLPHGALVQRLANIIPKAAPGAAPAAAGKN